MRRRDLIKGIAGSAAAWPFATRAQQPALPTIGFLGASSAAGWQQFVKAFQKRLHELGWTEGTTIAIEYRWAEGNAGRYADIAAEFVKRKVNVIVTAGSAVRAAMQATSTIPIVFAVAAEPLASGFVASLSHPGGNVTGQSIQSADVGPKRLEYLREVVRDLRQVAILANVGYVAAALELNEVARAAREIGWGVNRLEIRSAQDISPAIEGLSSSVQALYVCNDSLVVTHQNQIVALANAARLPTIVPNGDWILHGALLSYGPNEQALFAHAADYVDKILRGANPADIPVEQPTKFDLVINLKTAKALNIAIPDKILAIADEVIE